MQGRLGDLAELRPDLDPIGDVHQRLVGREIKVVDDRAEVELAETQIGEDAQITDRLCVVIGIGQFLAQQVEDIASDRPVQRGCGVVQQHLDVAPTYPNDDQHLLDQADEPDGAGIAGQPTQLGDQLLEVVGQICGQRDDIQLPVLAVGRDDEVDLVRLGVLRLVVIIQVALVRIVEFVAILEVIGVVGPGGLILGLVQILVEPGPVVHGVVRLERLVALVVDLRHAISSNASARTEPSPSCQTGPRSTTPISPILGRRDRPPTRYRSAVDLCIVDHPLVAHKITTLRDVETDSPTFRRLTEELVTLLAYEATREIRVAPVTVQTPVAPATGVRLARPRPLVVPILRAGLGMLEGMTRLMPTAEVGFLGMVRNEETLAASTYAERLPEDLSGRQCFVLDPMLATGGTLAAAVRYLVLRGASQITCICLLAAPEGIERVSALLDDLDTPCTLVTAAVDERLNERGYIVPGLGDAGDRLYGVV